jgi:hypothetical protein
VTGCMVNGSAKLLQYHSGALSPPILIWPSLQQRNQLPKQLQAMMIVLI